MSTVQAAAIKECARAVPSAPDADLQVEVDRRTIAFAGRATRADAGTLRTALSRVLDERGEINGLTVCLSVHTRPGQATYVGESIPAAVGVLTEFSGRVTFRAMWGGGGLTVVGWMRSADRFRFKNLATGAFPVDVSAVGILEELPAKVRVRMERIRISTSLVAQIEQFHPKAGLITLSTTSKDLLVACPGGWRGKTPAAAWKSTTCVRFDASTPAVLPDPGNDHTHLSVAVRPVLGTVNAIDLDLRYTAVDPSFECHVGGRAITCTLLPLRSAN